MPTEPHRMRDVAESFGADAERYDRARPEYPAEVVAAIAAPGATVLDVGCGTGIVARQFRAAGCTVLGVEPDERMAAVARDGGLDVEVSTFETWEPRGRRFDAVTAAQAWHWVDADRGAAQAARVLKPGGVLGIFWNVMQPPPEVAAELGAAFRRFVPDVPYSWEQPAINAYRAMADRAVAGITRAGVFAEPVEQKFSRDQDYTRQQWMDLLPTQGILSRAPQQTRDAFIAHLAGRLDAFTVRYTTLLLTASRD